VSNRPNRTASHSARVAQASQASQAGQSRNVALWVALAAIVVVAAIVAIAATRGGSDADGGGASPSGGTVVPSGDVHFGSVEVDGSALPQPVQGAADPAVGLAFPTITGQQFDGQPITVGSEGKAMIVLGLAHWCPHCQKEVPLLQGWLDDNGMPTDVDVRAVATATDENAVNFSPGEWLRREGWSVPTLVDDRDNTARAAMGIAGYPAFVVVGPDGTVVQRASGELTLGQWEQLLEAARTGRPAT
jgi:cytochrome c biogenesis protein CcmG/thiol:disulfide interchange protein DsbE